LSSITDSAAQAAPARRDGLVELEGAMVIIADNLMHESARRAETARAQLAGAVLQLRSLEPGADPRAISEHLSLVSVALDQLMTNVKSACEVALGAGADLDQSRAHSVLATMRENLHADANDVARGRAQLSEVFPEIEASADRVVRLMRDAVANVVAQRDAEVQGVRERMH
jgi:hypothetical protein